ncbi:MAG: transglycosylase SLT domain-containing protein [Bacteroidales bacterium]|nr:transglycosylase SLT domain-containing protein [Bacteroidales bacterium]MDD4216775.1 transglycosylase SLT domain-containing protein [Bacteroidales bacterium]MDY0142080.1 transglycosylase SLT domain-containing protein [Bacteroidales bacterium]
MKKYIIIILLINVIANTNIIADNDSIVMRKNDGYAMCDHLDSVLMDWFYYTGRDTINFLKPEDRFNFNTDISDSIFEIRVNNLVTPIDVAYNKNVQRYLDRYIKNGRWIAPKFLGLSHQYFPMFEEKLDSYNIPLELKYLAIIESALNPLAKSRAGATGLWQFMYKTGKGMGLEINSYIDERSDPEKSTDAACRYLKSLYETYNSWTLALAAYNAGPGTINNAIKRSGGKTNYWELYPYLPNETRNYVPGFIAIVYLFNYADEHNFKPEYIPFYEDVDTVMVKKQLHFAQLDSVLGIDIGQTRELNPQYKLDIIPAKVKEYPLRIRRQYISKFMELEDSIYNFMDTVFFRPEKYNYTPDEKYIDYAPIATQPEGTVELLYTVKSGDAVGLIASWYGVETANLRAWNGISGNMIRVGQKLKVYIPEALASKYKIVDSQSFDEKQRTIGINPDTNKPKEEPIDPNYEYYTVKSGDSPYGISLKYDGISSDDILKLNGITNPSSLRIGQKLKIRKKT